MCNGFGLYSSFSAKEKTKTVKEVTQLVLARDAKLCNFIEWKGYKLVYRRYASLYFVAAIDMDDNELITLETIHQYVEILDKAYGNVCELDLIMNFMTAYYLLDELIIGGEQQETSKKAVLRVVAQQDALEENPNDKASQI
ncbi:AP-1 complex subunit sigma-2 [Thecamonas trahens ATCC 50062]|uniref:AP complex subunit sigma n=1 Tax=Thecamonas trahens ATCC 50062 TaxID=461836 RepID=A0A0L0D8P4_THETB|nr:AP-1 complex subunit sigma-2 [Thecamonas trahens ATCC 50062]KNC47663.1 AP-1 complex subunit sigma-2 [Thecamonas trahens ATCC 50062]|eukprot:XP_013759147.1 AP-1 complex subunit sigma-2 [Thecamonas trahens ATCC 50062]